MWYELILTPDDNCTWRVTSPDFEELATYGDTEEEACRHGRDAIEEAIAARIAESKALPPSLKEKPSRGYFVEVSFTEEAQRQSRLVAANPDPEVDAFLDAALADLLAEEPPVPGKDDH